VLALVDAFGELFDQFSVEGFEVFGAAAGDEALIYHARLIGPVGTSVNEVGLDRGVGRNAAAFDDIGFDEQPGAVADGGDWLMLLEELADKGDRGGVGAEGVGVGQAAGDEKSVEDGGGCFGDDKVDGEAVRFVMVVEALDLTRGEADDSDFSARGFESLNGGSELDLLEAIGCEYGNFAARERLGVG